METAASGEFVPEVDYDAPATAIYLTAYEKPMTNMPWSVAIG
ncbi:hypothetical protein [Trueperella pyogenes]|nr:hypothetical protein [Trueperella pyogenes]AJC70488.1 hypothetical protein X956_03495 [Trueperella pyogenes TP8]